MLKFNNKVMKFGNYWGTGGSVTPPEPPEPTPTIPSDMDFIYFANDFDGSKIPNSASGANAFGPYLEMGTLTKNGSGSDCYISNGLSASNYLYYDLTSAQRDTMYGNNGNTYTFFLRVSNGSYYEVGGIFSWRANGGYRYMIRANGRYLQLHTSSGYDSSFTLDADQVYKVYINGDTLSAVKLSTGAYYNVGISIKDMGTRMTSFWAGYGSEGYLERIYALAGIPRATTAEEDEIIKTAMMNQSLTGDLNA